MSVWITPVRMKPSHCIDSSFQPHRVAVNSVQIVQGIDQLKCPRGKKLEIMSPPA
jgi:hypothetical protein